MTQLITLHHSIKQYINQRYDLLFNFYMAKDISDICYSKRHSKQVIDFQDFLKLDCEDEMLKRYYQLHQVSRINLLAEYYAKNRVLENESPAIYLTTGGKAMYKRIKRRVKKLEHKREQDEDFVYEGKSTFLKSIHSEDLRNAQDEFNLLDDLSMETDVYDIYKENENTLSYRQDVDRAETWKNIFSLKQEEEGIEDLDTFPGNLVLDFKALDYQRILKEYSILQNLNPQRIPKPKISSKLSRDKYNQQVQNKNATILKKSLPKSKQFGKAYIVKGLPSTKKYIRLDQQYLQEIGPQKERRFIKGFQAQTRQQLRSAKTKSGHLKIYSPDQPYTRFHQIKSKNRQSEQIGSPKRHNQYLLNLHSKSPQLDQRLHRIQTISSESKWRTKQYQDIKQRAQHVQEQALKTIYRFANKNIRSTQQILPTYRQI